MERFVTGDIVVVSFPFTDLSSARKRPALVLSSEGEDVIICEITSIKRKDNYVVALENKDLSSGRLKTSSIIRPNRLLTIHVNKINYRFGKINEEKFQEVLEKISKLFKI